MRFTLWSLALAGMLGFLGNQALAQQPDAGARLGAGAAGAVGAASAGAGGQALREQVGSGPVATTRVGREARLHGQGGRIGVEGTPITTPSANLGGLPENEIPEYGYYGGYGYSSPEYYPDYNYPSRPEYYTYPGYYGTYTGNGYYGPPQGWNGYQASGFGPYGLFRKAKSNLPRWFRGLRLPRQTGISTTTRTKNSTRM